MKLVGNSLYSLAGTAIPVVLSVITVPFYLSAIGGERYGALTIAWLVLGFFGAADFGIGRAMTRRMATLATASSASQAKALWSGIAAIALFGIIAAALLFAAAHWYFSAPFEVSDGIRDEVLRSVFLLALCCPIVALNGVLGGALMGLERFRMTAFATLLGNSGILLLPLATAYTFSTELPALVFASLAARLLATIVLAFSAGRLFLIASRPTISLHELTQLTSFGKWIMLSALVAPVILMSDRFLIGAFYDAIAVAAYAIPYQIASRTLLLPIAIGQVLFPHFARQEESKSVEDCRHYAIFLGQIFAPLIIVLICLSAPLLNLWLGDQLDERSIAVARIVLIGCWVNAIAHVPFAFIQGCGNSRFTALLHTAELPIFLALLAALGSLFGLAGFATAFALRCLLDCWALVWKAKLGWQELCRALVIPALLLLAALWGSFYFSQLAHLLSFAVLLVIVVIIAVLRFMPTGIQEKLQARGATLRLRLSKRKGH